MTQPTRETPAGRAYLDLQNRARREGRGTQELLTLYVVERWLARLSASRYADQFVLKGGMLLAANDARRPTVDVDAPARRMPNDEPTVVARIAEIAEQAASDDGVEFRTETARALHRLPRLARRRRQRPARELWGRRRCRHHVRRPPRRFGSAAHPVAGRSAPLGR